MKAIEDSLPVSLDSRFKLWSKNALELTVKT